jgi:hypothetical protein
LYVSTEPEFGEFQSLQLHVSTTNGHDSDKVSDRSLVKAANTGSKSTVRKMSHNIPQTWKTEAVSFIPLREELKRKGLTRGKIYSLRVAIFRMFNPKHNKNSLPCLTF